MTLRRCLGRFLPFGEDGEPRYEPEVSSGDAARIEVAWPAAGGADPYLREWEKAVPGPVAFEGVPCSFPGRVWKSKNTLAGASHGRVCR
jgi:hypothetical protein